MINLIRKSMFMRLLFSYLFSVLFGLGFVGVLMWFFVNGFIYDTKQEDLLRKAKKINSAIQHQSVLDEESREQLLFFDHSFDTRIWVFDTEGKIIATSTMDEVSIGKSVANWIVARVLQGEDAVSHLQFEGLTQQMLSVVVPWGKDDEVYGGIVLHSPVVSVKETIRNVRSTIIWGIALALILSTALVYFISWTISRTLRKIDKAAAEIGMGKFSKRIEVESNDELGDLAETINTMAAQLERNERERDKLDQRRNEYLANVSHELRTPLTTIQGFLEALQDGLIDAKSQGKYYDIMYGETIHMNHLLDDITDLIKLRNKDIALDMHPLSPEASLRKVRGKLLQEAVRKNLTIELELSDDLPQVHADPMRMEQILTNLVGNAVKFTDSGQIVLRAAQDGPLVKFSVEDSGAGISEADQESIWERFYKADKGRDKQNRGTGLGLAIVKELAELHGGYVAVESVLGEGSTFHVWIPAVDPAEGKASNQAAAAAADDI